MFILLMIVSLLMITIPRLFGSREKEFKFVVRMAGRVLFSILVMIILFEIGAHSSNVATSRVQYKKIKVYQNMIVELKNNLNSVIPNGKQTNFVLSNKDNPIASIVHAITQAQTSKAKSELRLAHALLIIEDRKIGTMWFIVYFYGDK